MSNFSRTPNLHDVFRGSAARRAGMITESQLRSSKYRRLFQDVYAPADLPVTHELRCRGAALIAPQQAILTGRSAATVRGVPLAKPHDPVELIVPEKHRFGPVQGIHVRRTETTRKDSKPWHGIRLARARRIALDLVLRLSPRRHGWVRRMRFAVPDLDAFLRSGNVRRSALFRYFRCRRNRGIRLARAALELTDTRAESPPESDLRVVLYYGGLNPRPQYTVRFNGRFVARLDLALVSDRVAVEYDGRWHDHPAQQRQDRRRRARLRLAGWRTVVVTAERLATDVPGLLDEIRRMQATRPAG
ncbi:DUF559 domain-containing protein [Haloechinothrix aidingensis]